VELTAFLFRTTGWSFGLWCRLAIICEDGGAGGVADSQLKLPLISPGLFLFILAEFNEDGVGTFFQVDGQCVLINPHTTVILIPLKDEFSVEPDFPGVFATKANLGRPGFRGLVGVVGVGNDFLQVTVGFVDVDHAINVGSFVVTPFDVSGFAFVGLVEIDLFFRRIDRGEAVSACIVKRTDHFPVHEKSEVSWQVDFLPGFGQGVLGLIDLINVTCGFECLLIKCGGIFRFSFVQYPLDGVSTEFHTGVIEHPCNQFVGCLWIGLANEFIGQTTGIGIVGVVGEELLKLSHREFGLMFLSNGVDGASQPVRGKTIGIVQGMEDLDDGSGITFGQFLPGFGGGDIASAFRVDCQNRFDGRINICGKWGT